LAGNPMENKKSPLSGIWDLLLVQNLFS